MAAKCWYLFVVAANISDRTGQCFDEGYVDGRDNTFSREPGNNEYHNGFVAGCLSVRGNTVEVCEEATDS
jgi:hypothetical protein